MTTDTGGPVHPTRIANHEDPRYSSPGMTLRQHYAGIILVGMIGSEESMNLAGEAAEITGREAHTALAAMAIAMADELIKVERESRGQS